MPVKIPPPVEHWIVVFSGFLEEGHLSGMECMHDALRLQCSTDDRIVLLKSWKDNVGHIAERMFNRRPVDHQPRITIAGFSYGGMSATLLAKELAKYQWSVELMFLIDAVYRWGDSTPSFLSMLKFWKIKVPENVKVLYSWRQSVTKPSGHELKVNKQKTQWIEQTLAIPHRKIDEVSAIHERALQLSC